MKIEWVISGEDKKRFRSFVEKYKGHPIVQVRQEKNVDRKGLEVSKPVFWKTLIGCLLTTQQKSGAGSNVNVFLQSTNPLLNCNVCLKQKNLAKYAKSKLQGNGLRRINTISSEIEHAIEFVNANRWQDIERALESIKTSPSMKTEREVARSLQGKLKGLGPKQSRNLIQWMGLSQYEIPLDSRIMKVLKELSFPVPLGANALANEEYYCFVEDGLQKMLSSINVLPCLFDACAFASFEKDSAK
jgi:hypothetical protein